MNGGQALIDKLEPILKAEMKQPRGTSKYNLEAFLAAQRETNLDIHGDGRLGEDKKPGLIASRTRNQLRNLGNLNDDGTIPKRVCIPQSNCKQILSDSSRIHEFHSRILLDRWYIWSLKLMIPAQFQSSTTIERLLTPFNRSSQSTTPMVTWPGMLMRYWIREDPSRMDFLLALSSRSAVSLSLESIPGSGAKSRQQHPGRILPSWKTSDMPS
jgi:hypothetical protein